MTFKSLFVQIVGVFVECLALTVVSVSPIWSATISVPGDSPTIQGAIDMAATGDTVLITDSAVYEESIAIQKVITVMAAAGQNPILRYDAANMFPASYMILCGSPGAQIGSNAGGQIILDGLCDNRVTHFFRTPVKGVGEVVFENFFCVNCFSSRQFIYPDPDSAAAIITFNNVIARGNGCDPNTRFDDCDFMIRPDFLNGATLNLNNCEFTGADRMVILHGGGDTFLSFGTVNITDTYLSGRELAVINEPDRALPTTWHVVDSVLESTISPEESEIFGSFSPWFLRAEGQIVGATRSVFIDRGVGTPFYVWFPGDHSLLTFDHCDFIRAAPGGVGIRMDAATLPGARTLSVRNCNIVSQSAGFFGSVVASDVFINDYNNVLGGYGGIDTVKPEIMGANDIIPSVTPDYFEPGLPGLNFGYTEPTLLTGDEVGGPVGSFLLFGTPPPPTPTEVPTSRVSDWNLYN